MKKLSSDRKRHVVAIWLMVGVFMIVIQIILGGITRLTGSGLSITQWKPIMGVLPPLNHESWLSAFEQYKQYGQFKRLNSDFNLDDFKFIFFWEWFHRLWARSLGVVFIIPFIYFIIKKYFSKDMIAPLIFLFFLGGLQGLIGWIMVQSGLTSTNISVSHIKLTIHFISALILLGYTFWFALKLLIPKNKICHDAQLNSFLLFTLAVLTLQLIYGGFMAGLKAARYAPTWPSINGQIIPSGMIDQNWIDHTINVHFIHRSFAYILVVLILWSCFKVIKLAKVHHSVFLRKSAKWPLILISIQLLLGILTVLSSIKIVNGHFGLFETLAVLHQLTAIILLLTLLFQYYLVSKKR